MHASSLHNLTLMRSLRKDGNIKLWAFESSVLLGSLDVSRKGTAVEPFSALRALILLYTNPIWVTAETLDRAARVGWGGAPLRPIAGPEHRLRRCSGQHLIKDRHHSSCRCPMFAALWIGRGPVDCRTEPCYLVFGQAVDGVSIHSGDLHIALVVESECHSKQCLGRTDRLRLACRWTQHSFEGRLRGRVTRFTQGFPPSSLGIDTPELLAVKPSPRDLATAEANNAPSPQTR